MTPLLALLASAALAADLSTLPGMEGTRPQEKPRPKPTAKARAKARVRAREKPRAQEPAKQVEPEKPERVRRAGDLVSPLPLPPGSEPGYEAELRSPLYGMRVPKAWKGPEALEDGVKLTEPGGNAYFTVRFLETGSPEWQAPPAFRSSMQQKGGIEDSHVSDIVKLGGRFASRVRFTIHDYAGKRFLGEKDVVYYTELIMAPDPDGLYVVEYRALKSGFDAHRSDYLRMLRSLAFPARRMEAEPFYTERDNLEKDLFEEKVLTRT